jgi:hypothetical protein
MSYKRSVIVKGSPEINEDLAASAAVNPGYLVVQTTAVAHHASAGALVPAAVALERDELGTGIDNTFQGEGTGSAFYASGDTVKVAVGYPGCQFTMFLASGYTVARNGLLQSHGNGQLRPTEANQFSLFTAIDAVAAGVAAVTAIRVQVL